VLLIAAGIGITPIRALVEELAAEPSTRPGDVTLLYRGNDENSVVFRSELEWLSRHTPIRIETLLGPSVPGSWLPQFSPRWRPRADTETLARIVPGLPDHDVYLCGPPAWMALVRKSLDRAGVPRGQVHDERFGW
jgi:ferredoxin-NADP reductase